MYGKLQDHLKEELQNIKEEGLYKSERIIEGEQGAEIDVNGKKVLNFCSNNYLGLSSHPEVVKAAKETLDTHGFGMSSVRFICGPKTFTKPWSKKLPLFAAPKTRFYTQPPLTPTVAYLSRCSPKKTPLSLIH